MSLPSRLSRMAHRFFSQLVTEDESEIEEVEEAPFEPHSEDLTVEYDTCVDICSVIDTAVAGGVVEEVVIAADENAENVESVISVEESEDDRDDVSSVGYAADVSHSDKNITATIVKDTVKGPEEISSHGIEIKPDHVHSQAIKITKAPRLRPDLSDSEMSGISDAESEVEVEAVDSDAPLTDVINGIVRQRRKEAQREARKRNQKQKKHKGYKIAKPHKRHEHNAKELEAIERQLQED